MEHKYTVSLEESNDKQEKVNSCKEKTQKLEAEIRQLQITINKQAEEVSTGLFINITSSVHWKQGVIDP